jgi:hypothetical protein
MLNSKQYLCGYNHTASYKKKIFCWECQRVLCEARKYWIILRSLAGMVKFKTSEIIVNKPWFYLYYFTLRLLNFFPEPSKMYRELFITLKANRLLDSPTFLTFKNCTFCPYCIYVFCIYLRRKSKFAIYNLNWLVFITETKSVYCALWIGSLNKTVDASSLKG